MISAIQMVLFIKMAFIQIPTVLDTWLQNSVDQFNEFYNVVGTVDKKASHDAVEVLLVVVRFVNFQKISGGHRKVGSFRLKWKQGLFQDCCKVDF